MRQDFPQRASAAPLVELDAPPDVFAAQLERAAEADAMLFRDPRVRREVQVDMQIEAAMLADRRRRGR